MFPLVLYFILSCLDHSADLDPIYYCELLDQCEINDNGDATITNATAIPKSGPQGSKAYVVDCPVIITYQCRTISIPSDLCE